MGLARPDTRQLGAYQSTPRIAGARGHGYGGDGPGVIKGVERGLEC
jgi:hypothetical protein